MILDKSEVDARLNNPENLINRLRRIETKSNVVSIPPSVAVSSEYESNHPSLPPSVDELINDVTDKVNTAKIQSASREVLLESIERLRSRLIEVDSPVQLSKIATDMGRVISGFEKKDDGNKQQNIIIFKPIVNSEQHYETIHVHD